MAEMRRTTEPGRIDVERDFDSWDEFVASAADERLFAWKATRGSHSRSSGWAGTETFDEAVRMATTTGWPEGRQLMYELLVAVAPRPEPYASLAFEVAGAYPCVPLYCANDPACMIIDPGSDLRHAQPIVRIDYNIGTFSHVKPRDIMLRGAAVLSLAETLERHRYSTELRIVDDGKAGSKFAYRWSIVYKKAGEPLDLDRAAFALAHPATPRRLSFAIVEQHAELERDFSSYGAPMHEPNDPTSGKPGGAIFISGSKGNETPETARRAVEEAARELLTNIQMSEADD